MPIDAAAVRPGHSFLDLEFSPLAFEAVLEEVACLAGRPDFSYIVTPNVDHVVKLQAEPGDPVGDAFRRAYGAAELRLCDSRILAALAALFGIRLPVVPGSDLTSAVFRRILSPGDRVALVGGARDTVSRLEILLPGVEFVQHLPPMGMLANPAAMREAEDFVSQCGARFILFATGAPQSEILAHSCLERGEAGGVGLCIGASIEFLLGDQRRAPRWMQQVGLEWAHRLATNPRRLWRRYLVEGPRIFLITARWWRARRKS